MLRMLVRIALFTAIMVCPLFFRAYASTVPSSDKIINAYKKATGGKAADRIKSTIMEGTIKDSNGLQGHFTLQSAAPDRIRIDIAVGENQSIVCYNGKSSWLKDSKGLSSLLGSEIRGMRLLTVLFNSRLRGLAFYKVIPGPAITVDCDGIQAYQIEFGVNDVTLKMCFDIKTALPLKLERESGGALEVIHFSNYRTVDGVAEPVTIKYEGEGKDFTISVERIEHNKPIDQTAFRYPKVEGSAPLPNLEILMKSLMTNQKHIEELMERYSFRQTYTEKRLDGKGKVEKTETREFDVTPVAGRFVRRLVSIEGKPLSTQEQEKVDNRVQKQVSEILERRAKEEEEKKQAAREGKPVPEKKNDVTILRFLEITEVSSVRREVFRGKEVIAFDFEPRKGFKPSNRVESIVNLLAGTFWVDENAKQVVRLETRFTGALKIGGGILASVLPSTAMVFEQEKINDEVWLPSYSEEFISLKLLMFKKINQASTMRNTDYKKYQIEGDYKLNKVKETGVSKDVK